MITTDGDRKFCEECGTYSATTKERVVPCFDECRCSFDLFLCTPCANERERELERVEKERDRS